MGVMKMNSNILKIHPADTILVALKNLAAGETITYNGSQYTLRENIPAKHKFYMNDSPAGTEVIMYGVLVGKTEVEVPAGSRVSTENLKHASRDFDFRGFSYTWTPPDVSSFRDLRFNGYHRHDGRVGTANYWLFIPTVFCENRNLDVIKEVLQDELGYAVTQKYKSYTHHLAEAYKKGEDITTVDLSASQTDAKAGRLFKNVDGIKFLNHQGGCGGTRQD